MQQDWKKVQFNNLVTALLFLEDIINLLMKSCTLDNAISVI